MPLLVAPFIALSVGILLGSRRAGSLGARGGAVAHRCATWLAVLGFFPVVAFFSLYRPAWAYLHIVDGAALPSFVTLLLAAAASSLVVLGHSVGRKLGALPQSDGAGPRLGQASPMSMIAAAIPFAFAVLLLAAMPSRVLVVEPARGVVEAVRLTDSRFGLGLLLMDLLLALAVWLTARAERELEESEIDRADRASRGTVRVFGRGPSAALAPRVGGGDNS